MDFNRLKNGLQRRAKRYICYESYLALKLNRNDLPSQLNHQLRFKVIDNAEEIINIYKLAERPMNGVDWRVSNRLAKGLKFYACYLNDVLVASLWIIEDSERFLDEAAIHFYPNKNSIWLRDIFVLAPYRGVNLFTEIICTLCDKYYSDSIHYIYSDTMSVNTSSVNAHRKCGFQVVSTVKRLQFFDRVLLRLGGKGDIDTNWFKPKAKLLIKNSQYEQYTRSHVA